MQKALRVSFPVLLSVLAFGAAAPFALAMTTPGTVTSSPTQAMSEGIGTSWSLASINNSLLVDGIPAQTSTIPAGTASQSLVLTGFNFNVPTNATITGVELSVTRRSPVGSGTSLQDSTIALVGGFGTSTSLATTDPWPTALSAAVYGGSANTWGVGLTPSEVNSANFGVAIAVQNTDTGGHGAYVDGATITVYYTTSAPATLEVGAGKPYATIQSAITAAESGDTVSIAAGIYAEKLLISGKTNLTIQGVGDASLIEPAYDDSGAAGITIMNSNGLTIKDLKIHTSGREMEGIWVYGVAYGGNAITGLTIQNTTIQVDGGSTGQAAAGIIGDSAGDAVHSGWHITGNRITVAGTGSTPMVLQDVSASEFSRNIVTNSSTGASTIWSSERYSLSSITFSDNQFSGGANRQIYFLTDYNHMGTSIPEESPAVATNITGVTFHGNTFSNWGQGALRVGEVSTGHISNFNITNNTFEMSADTADSPIAVMMGAPTLTGGSSSSEQNIFNVSGTAKIQKAVNAAFSGDMINVAAGTYTEQVTINKSLTVAGDDRSTTILQAPTVPVADSLGKNNILKVTGGATATVTNLGVTNAASTTCTGIDYGIYVVGGATLNINHSAVSSCQNTISIRAGSQFQSQVGHLVADQNTISGYQKGGIVVDGTGSTGTITNNTITGTGPTGAIAQNGIQMSRGATGLVTGNTVNDNYWTDAAGNPSDNDPTTNPANADGAAGILLYQAGSGISVAQNILTGN